MDQATRGSPEQPHVKVEFGSAAAAHDEAGAPPATAKPRQRNRRKNTAEPEADDSAKRRCVSTACMACRKRKSKCDGNLPACAACSQVYRTECIYDPNSDHRRKGVYKSDIENLKPHDSTLHTLIQAILNYPEEEVQALVREIRTCESLDAVADKIVAKKNGLDADDDDDDDDYGEPSQASAVAQMPTFETQLYGKMGDLRLDEGSVRYIGGTSNLIHLTQEEANEDGDEYPQQENPITSWTKVTDNEDLVIHLLHMYFTWHYTYFTTLSKGLFYRDFFYGKPPANTRRKTYYCTPLLVNAMLALGCHFTSRPDARANPDDPATAGDHFFREAKRLIMDNDEHEKPRLTNIQALALMSVREAGCGREAKGWVYSGMSFRMACDMGLNLDTGRLTTNRSVNGDEAEEDVRRITFWGCYLFDKCWSNYLGRLPQLPTSIITVPKFEVFPEEDASEWIPYTDSGFVQAHAQPSRTRAVAMQISKLCEISNDLMRYFYNPTDMEKTKGKAAELKKLSDIHTRLEAWRRELPKEMEPKEGGLPSILVMHMFFQLLYIHLFRPFLKYTQATSPLPHNVSPRRLCTQAAAMISKLMRLYKRSHGLRQICNVAAYIVHSACTIHLLNLPDKNSRRDIVHGLKHLEEIAESWLCARRTLVILSVLAHKWNVALPEEATAVLARTDEKFGSFFGDVPSPSAQAYRRPLEHPMTPSRLATHATWQNTATLSGVGGYLNNASVPVAGTGTTQQGAPVRKNSRSYTLPPDDANGLRALQYPSAAATPASAQGQQPPKREGTGPAHPSGSPSDMFGEIEQLMPGGDSQDWVYRDQAQIALGFDNWSGLDSVDPSTWANGVTGEAGMNGASPTGSSGAAAMPNGMSLSTAANPMYATGDSVTNGVNGFSTSWLNGIPYNNIATYNEDEWYQ